MSKLYLIPTPVGNMEDITLRALRLFKEVDVILAEDTRTTAKLLKHYEIGTPLLSHHKFNEHQQVDRIAERIEKGENIALVSDAGTPGISDPGFLLSRECRRRGLEVETLPGATAFVPALVNSGLPCDRFSFEGFLPPKKGRETAMKRIAEDDRTTVVYESPLRLLKTLEQLASFCGADRPMSVSREISKLHETTVRGTAAELIAHFSQNQPRGEIVIIIGGKENSGRASHRNKFKPED